MPLTDSGSRQLGAEMSFHAYSEASWGVTPDTPDYIFLPLESFSLVHTTDRRESRPYFGQMAKKHGRRFKPRVEGSIAGALYGDHITDNATSKGKAQWLLEKVFGTESGATIPSFGILRQEPLTDAGKRFPGLRINQFTLQGSADTGRIDWNASLMGLPEVEFANASYRTVPNDLHKLTEFEYYDSTFTIDDYSSSEGLPFCFESFTLTRAHGLKPRFGNCSQGPTSINRTTKDTQFTFRIEKKNNNWDDARRLMTEETEFGVTMILKGKHSGTGGSGTEYAVVTITLPRCQLLNPVDADTFDDVSMIDVSTEVLKPDSSSAQVSVAYSEE